MEMARVALALAEPSGSPEEQWKRLSMVYREVSLLRRDDQRAERARIQRERWEREQEREAELVAEQERKEFKQQALAMVGRPAMVAATAKSFGGGRCGAMLAELAERIKADEEPERIMAWYEAAQKWWPKVAEQPKYGRRGKRGNGETRVRNGRKEAKEAPSTNIQAPEKDQAPKLGGAEGAAGQLANNKQVPKSFEDEDENEDEAKRQVPENGARETEGIGVNPSKSNQIFEQPRNEGTKE
jgi:hypothetical protein